jgi:hypothetical protein
MTSLDKGIAEVAPQEEKKSMWGKLGDWWDNRVEAVSIGVAKWLPDNTQSNLVEKKLDGKALELFSSLGDDEKSMLVDMVLDDKELRDLLKNSDFEQAFAGLGGGEAGLASGFLSKMDIMNNPGIVNSVIRNMHEDPEFKEDMKTVLKATDESYGIAKQDKDAALKNVIEDTVNSNEEIGQVSSFLSNILDNPMFKFFDGMLGNFLSKTINSFIGGGELLGQSSEEAGLSSAGRTIANLLVPDTEVHLVDKENQVTTYTAENLANNPFDKYKLTQDNPFKKPFDLDDFKNQAANNMPTPGMGG